MQTIRYRLGVTVVCLALLPHFAAAAQQAPFPAWTPMPGVSAEGVALDRSGNLYVTVREGANGIVVRYAKTGDATRVAEIGPGMIGGLAVAAQGDVYVAVAQGAARGVYGIRRGGAPQLLPGTDRIAFANALAFDRTGTLYVTESYSLNDSGGYGAGGIWRVQPGGQAEPWLRHPLLTGVGAALGYPVGANGIASFSDALFVANTDKGLVVRIPVTPRGEPGEPEVWASLGEVEGSPLAGNRLPPMGDGLAIDVHGNIYVAVVSRCAIVRLDAVTRTQEPVAFFQFGPPGLPLNAPLDTPASLAFGTGAGEQGQLFATNLGMMPLVAPGPPWPGAGVVKIDTGVPGWPIR